jgi:F-type H+-transporting ATPase subunit epsilon
VRLAVTTPAGVVVDSDDVRHVRAEDATGAFGILPHHDAFLTVLAISVITWRDRGDREHHVAVRGGVLRVSCDDRVEVATRDAEAGDDLEALEHAVVARYRAEDEATAAAHREAARVEAALVRRILRYLRPGARIGSVREESLP